MRKIVCDLQRDQILNWQLERPGHGTWDTTTPPEKLHYKYLTTIVKSLTFSKKNKIKKIK